MVVFPGDLGPAARRLIGRFRSNRPTRSSSNRPMAIAIILSLAETAVQAREAIKATVERGGRVLVPVFAIGRSQLLLYLLAGAFKRKTLNAFPDLSG